jgi:hypothetical protein
MLEDHGRLARDAGPAGDSTALEANADQELDVRQVRDGF